jgi:dephospho-CoA kinase
MPDPRYRHQFRPAFSRLHEDRDLRWVVPLTVRYVLAIVGGRYSGKSAALAYLAEKRGFHTYTLTDDLRNEARRRGISPEPRHKLHDLAEELRAEHEDNAYLARLTLRRIHRDNLAHRNAPASAKRIAVAGIKRLEELEQFELLPAHGVICLKTDPDCMRYERARDAGLLARELEAIVDDQGRSPAVTKESFEHYLDERDLGTTKLLREGRAWTAGYCQDVRSLLDLDFAKPIDNSGRRADMYTSLDRVVHELDEEYRAVGG